jgi:Fe-S cluster assembly iron-binding protein IscA
LTLDESKNEEQTYTVNEVELMIDENVLPYTKGNEIDYISNAYGQGFSIAPTMGGGSCC